MEHDPLYPADVVDAYRQAGLWTDDTFAHFFHDAARRYPQREAICGPDLHGNWASLSYQELATAIDATAAALTERGIRGTDYVVIQLPNIVDYVVYVAAVFRVGAVPVFSLNSHGLAEITHFIRTTSAAGYIGSTRAGADAAVLQETFPDLLMITEPAPRHAQASDAQASTAQVFHPAAPSALDLAFLQVSGGTTGTPKLIPRTHADYLYSVRESAKICQLSPQTRFLVALPASHNFTMSSPGILGVLYAGGTVVMCDEPAPSAMMAMIAQHQVTMTALVPPLALMWARLQPMLRCDLASLQLLQVGGAKLTPEAAQRVSQAIGCQLQQVFGMAEGLVNYTRLHDSHDLVINTQGRPMSPADEIIIVDDNGKEVPLGESGRLLTRGPYTIRRYFNHADPGSFTEDGFYCTGDIVRQLPTGHLVIEGREKDQINRGGEKISAEEIENHLLAHPGINDAAVVSVPDDYLGERCGAFILTEQLTEPEIREHLRKRGVAEYKIPDVFRIAANFPFTGVGKISRKDLRRQLQHQFV